MVSTLFVPSPNFNERNTCSVPTLIVLHYTEMEKEAALKRLCDPIAKVSAHYFIDQQGKIYQLVADHHRAWHAGVSCWKGEKDVNSISLGIELDNKGHAGGLPAYPSSQINSLLLLLKHLTEKYAIPPTHIVGHSDIAPLRKQDPGEHFPWAVLYQQGFGIWPQDTAFLTPLLSIQEIQKALNAIGYDCPLTNILDPITVAVIKAFQRHFTPQEITGQPSELLKYTLRCIRT